jgi:hypothetical protein
MEERAKDHVEVITFPERELSKFFPLGKQLKLLTLVFNSNISSLTSVQTHVRCCMSCLDYFPKKSKVGECNMIRRVCMDWEREESDSIGSSIIRWEKTLDGDRDRFHQGKHMR